MKRIIYLHMLERVLTQNDTLDYKPILETMHGEGCESVRGTRRLSTMVEADLIPHRRAGVEVQAVRRNGTMVSDAVPHMGRIIDDLCLIKTMNTEHVNHDPASKFLHTGFRSPGALRLAPG